MGASATASSQDQLVLANERLANANNFDEHRVLQGRPARIRPTIPKVEGNARLEAVKKARQLHQAAALKTLKVQTAGGHATTSKGAAKSHSIEALAGLTDAERKLFDRRAALL